MHEYINPKDWNEEDVERFDWRLDLIYRYKMYFDPDTNFSSEQMDFINGHMRREKKITLAYRYHLAITDAIQLEEATKQRIRMERLTAAKAKRSTKR